MTKQMTMLACAAVLAGCSVVGNPPSPKDDAVIQTAGDIGAVACAVAKAELDGNSLIKAKMAVLAAKTVLNDPEPNLENVKLALSAGVDEQWANVAAVLVQRLKKRLNDADVLPVDSLAWKSVSEALDACQMSLG